VPGHLIIAKESLERGRWVVERNGVNGLVPYIKGGLFIDLVVAAMGHQDLPGNFDESAPGHGVNARATFECGWWEYNFSHGLIRPAKLSALSI